MLPLPTSDLEQADTVAKRVRPAAVVICAWLSLVGTHCCVTFGSFLEVVGVLTFRVIFFWNMLLCCICFIANFHLVELAHGCSCPDLAQAYLGSAQILHLQGGAVRVLLVFASPCPFLVSTSLALWALALSVSLSSLGE